MSMMPENNECGVRHRFTVQHRDTTPNAWPAAMERLAHWCAVFDAEGLAPVEGGASAGNLSFRTPAGFVITPTRSRLKTGIDWTSFVEVVRADQQAFELHVLGRGIPSSDAFLHERIYAARTDVAAVLHGHDALVLQHAQALCREFPIALTTASRVFGTLEDSQESANELGTMPYLIRLGHGFVSVARTMDAAGELAVKVHRRAAQLAAQG
ncbi:MAG: hypothetical protein EXS14_07185 [Planctomycetes bacterium]|nr:hypothetical protein [Planctomycetota bacterium]